MSITPRRTAGLAAALAASTALLTAQALPGRAVPVVTGKWTQLAVGAAPGQPQSLAYDPGRGQLVVSLYDKTAGTFSTAVLHGTTWQVSAPNPLDAMPVFGGSSLVFDPTLGEVVAVNGLCASTWNGSTWSSVVCAQGAALTFYASRVASYDGDHGAVLSVVDTYTGYACCPTVYDDTETWTWDGSSWHQLAPTHEPVPQTVPQPVQTCPDPLCLTVGNNPVFSAPYAATWDAGRRQVVLVGDGGTMWTWNGTDWSGGVVLAPTADNPPSVTYDPAIATDVLYNYPERTSTWTGAAWLPLATTGLPPVSGALVDDPQLGGLVLLAPLLNGGLTTNGKHATLWLFTPGA